MKEYIVGIDFGNGETAAWCVSLNGQLNQSVNLLPATGDGGRKLRTVMRKCSNGSYSYVGKGKVLCGFKKRISQLNDEEKSAYGAFIKEVYNRILANNKSYLSADRIGNSNFYLCIAAPTRWTKQEKHEYLDFFNQVLSEFHQHVHWVINESDAAYFTHKNGANGSNILVIDYGSSTIDYTVMSNGKKISDDNWSNDYLGARSVEKAMLQAYRTDETANYQVALAKNIERLQQTNNGHIDILPLLELYMREIKEARYSGGHNNYSVNYDLFDETAIAGFDVFNHQGIFRSEGTAKGVCEDYINVVRMDFEKLKNDINKKGIHLDSIILSGGACIMSWVKELVIEVFGDRITIVKDAAPEYVVAKGVALYAKRQIMALNDFLDQVKKIDFTNLYIQADANSIKEAEKQMFPGCVQVIKKISPITANQIRQEYCNFIMSFDANNQTYNEIIQNEFNALVGKEVATMLAKVVQEQFNVSIDGNDVKIRINVPIVPYSSTEFLPGGSIYDSITDFITSSSNALFWGYFFDWNQVRVDPQKSNIIDGVADSWIAQIGVKYNPDVSGAFASMIDKIKTEVIDNATRIFSEKQLFETTFRETN
jgi:hypothetical protein